MALSHKLNVSRVEFKSRSFWRRTSQPITWLILTNKTVQENTQKIQYKKQTTQNTAKQNYPGSVAFYDTRPGNEVGLFYSSRAHMGQVKSDFNPIKNLQTWLFSCHVIFSGSNFFMENCTHLGMGIHSLGLVTISAMMASFNEPFWFILYANRNIHREQLRNPIQRSWLEIITRAVLSQLVRAIQHVFVSMTLCYLLQVPTGHKACCQVT